MTFPSIPENVDFGQHDEIDGLEGIVRRRLNGRVRDFRLLLQDNGLILQGYAFTYHAKQLAQHAIMKATRLPIIANEIEIGAFLLRVVLKNDERPRRNARCLPLQAAADSELSDVWPFSHTQNSLLWRKHEVHGHVRTRPHSVEVQDTTTARDGWLRKCSREVT